MIYYKDNEFISEQNDVDSCPVCDNRIGFAFGTCVDCGFNHNKAEFRYIKVNVDYLPKELKEQLIAQHARNYNVESFREGE